MAPVAEKTCLILNLFGQVQGVGLRPFLFRLAKELHLLGRIYNHAQGATAELEGGRAELERLCVRVLAEASEPIKIRSVEKRWLEARGFETLEITQGSKGQGSSSVSLSISADRATCGECWREFHDPSHRLWGYPFISCTACGPRWTIVRKLPFEREQTSYADFPLCGECRADYENPSSRRFHAQTLSCRRCGPRARLFFREEGQSQGGQGSDAFSIASHILKRGGLGVIKGIGGFQLVCDGENMAAIARLRQLKSRREKALAVMIRDEGDFSALGGARSDWLRMTDSSAPIVSVAGVRLPTREVLAPDLKELGVMAPTTPFHRLLLGEIRCMVVTSANRKGEPLPLKKEDISFALGEEIDFVLDHDRTIEQGVDDSVIRKDLILRQARGLAPHTESRECGENFVTLGADLKNSAAIGTRDARIELPYAGELKELALLERQKAQIGRALSLLEIRPLRGAKDIHPESLTGYLCPKHVENLLSVPHHLAHALAVHAELQTDLVLTFDGTGTNEAQELWGGEGFRAGGGGVLKRVLSLRATHLIGGEKAILSPWRSLVSMLAEDGLPLSEIQSVLPSVVSSELELQYALTRKAFGPLCSSMGRWFDAASALIEFGAREQSYEAQAPMRLETIASPCQGPEVSPSDWVEAVGDLLQVDGVRILSLLRELKKEGTLPAAELAFLAHQWMAQAVAIACRDLGASTVGAGGGVFQNELFFQCLRAALSGYKIELKRPRLRPVNDQSIAFGQMVFLERSHPCTS